MSLGKFLSSKILWLNLILAIILTIVIIWLTMVGIARYTNHGEAFATPNFNGLNYDNMTNLADQKSVNLEIQDSLFNSKYEPGTVIEQLPRAGHYIKEGRTIYVTIAAVNPEQIPMPKLTDVSLRQAKVIIESKGFQVGKIGFRPSEYDNLVLTQNVDGSPVEEGTLISRGTMIDLVVGRVSSNHRIPVPDFKGMNLQHATERLFDASLDLGAVMYHENVRTAEDSINAVVWRQSPQATANKQVDLGTAVDFWLRVADIEEIENDEFGF